MNPGFRIRPNIIARDDIAVAAAWGDVFTLDKIDTFSADATTNDVEVQFAYRGQGDTYEWVGDPVLIAASAGWQGFDNSDLENFSHFRFRRRVAASAATVSVRAVCKGRV